MNVGLSVCLTASNCDWACVYGGGGGEYVMDAMKILTFEQNGGLYF